MKSMRRVLLCTVGGLAGCLAFSTAVEARGPDPADYPLRVHVLKNTAFTSRARQGRTVSDTPDYLEGRGAADLFEGGVPMGFLFKYDCTEPLRASEGYATYPARWKKRDKVLEILLPEPGKPWNTDPCGLQVETRPGLAFFWNPDDYTVTEQPAAKFQEWMAKHHYDPEKDLDLPLDVGPEPAPKPKVTAEPGTSTSETPGPK
jgi:hypothetical protein